MADGTWTEDLVSELPPTMQSVQNGGIRDLQVRALLDA